MIRKLWRWLNFDDVLDNLVMGFAVVVGVVVICVYG